MAPEGTTIHDVQQYCYGEESPRMTGSTPLLQGDYLHGRIIFEAEIGRRHD